MHIRESLSSDDRSIVINRSALSLSNMRLSNQGPLDYTNLDTASVDQVVEDTREMTDTHSYIDARLAGIEKDVASAEKRMASAVRSIYRQNRDAEQRFERTSERHSSEMALMSQRIGDTTESIKKHVTTTAWTIAAVLVTTLAIVIGVFSYWVSEQGSYAKSYGENQVQIQQAADERAEFRDAVKSIQATQQSILDRLPAEQPSSPQQ